MPIDLWLPRNLELPDHSSVGCLLFHGEAWQIYETLDGGRALIARIELAAKWVTEGLLADSLFVDFAFGQERFRLLNSSSSHVLCPVAEAKSPESKVDALAFSVALSESRGLLNSASFHDAIFVERYSRLLPTWTLSPRVADSFVLGTWLTGGVAISTDSFRRLSILLGWMSSSDVADVVEAAGLSVQTAGSALAKRKLRLLPDDDSESSVEIPQAHMERSRSDSSEAKARFTLAGRPNLEAFFNEHVVDIILHPERYERLGVEFPSAVVLHGPPGCGKTYAVERLVDFLDWPNFSIDSNSVGSPFIHDTSKKISQVFEKAIDAAPSVLIIDEMESFLSERGAGGVHGLYHVEEVAEFLRRIPEAIKSKVLIIAMTNMIEAIDPAILRRGRFDHVVEVTMPTKIEVLALLDALLAKLPRVENLSLDALGDALTGRPLSDVAFVVREAARLAARHGKAELDQASIDTALASSPRSIEKTRRPIGFVREP